MGEEERGRGEGVGGGRGEGGGGRDDERNINFLSYSLCHSLYVYFNPEPEFTFHERQEQEYYLQDLGPARHPPAHQLTEAYVGEGECAE